jgi:putative Mg2+ transporter-C (MgtC) family protein
LYDGGTAFQTARRAYMLPTNDYDLLLRPLIGMVAGGLIGLERSFHGRAAGLRTYALVCLGSALLVAATERILPTVPGGTGDPTRVIQGIVTGIGFLGAGVILKEGFVVRGLTTAASIWVTSAVGVVIGAGFLYAGLLATALTLGTLSVLRTIEDRMRVQRFAHCQISFLREHALDEAQLRELVGRIGFKVTELSYKLDARNGLFEYKFVIWSSEPEAGRELQRSLLAEPNVVQFKISPSRD